MDQDRPYSGDARTQLVEHFFMGTGSTYDSMVHWATLGIDRLWKERIVALIPDGSGPVLDLACGTGISTLAIARRFPGRRIVGVELRDEYLAIAREKVRMLGLQNIELVLRRAEDYRSRDKFDCVTSSYLAKYAELPLLTAHCKSMLKAGGLLLMHDFTLPPNRVLQALWHCYFLVMRNTVARAIPSWMPIYEGLPRLIIATRWLDELEEALAACGFTGIRREYLTLCGSAIVTAMAAEDVTNG
jgi:demethylmenaquinone methyltransferase/2-methoxy-6-polyprenyl-1,4-benzoquinol methylase